MRAGWCGYRRVDQAALQHGRTPPGRQQQLNVNKGFCAVFAGTRQGRTMNTRDLNLALIPDVQSSLDTRRIAIHRVGVKGVRYPVVLKTQSGVQHSVGTWNMYVHLPEDQ